MPSLNPAAVMSRGSRGLDPLVQQAVEASFSSKIFLK